MTITNLRQNRLFKSTNIVLIYALLLNVTVPFAQTMDKLLTAPISYSPGLVISPLANNSDESPATDQTTDSSEELLSELQPSNYESELPVIEENAEIMEELAAVSTSSTSSSSTPSAASPGPGG